MKKSLLIVGAPRSGTTLAFQVCKTSLDQELNTQWSGIDLKGHKNRDAILFGGEVLSHGVVWGRTFSFDEKYEVTKKFLDKNCVGKIIKDAASLQFIHKYIKENPNKYNVLYIHRNPASCVHRVLERKWFWIIGWCGEESYISKKNEARESIKDDPKSWEYRQLEYLPYMVDNILLMQSLCSKMCDQQLYFDHLVKNPEQVFLALEKMGYKPNWYDYITPGFRSVRQKQVKHTKSALWQIAEKSIWIRGKLLRRD